jgi:hypothetical protein
MGVRLLGYIPDDWHTSAYEHCISTKTVGLFGRITMHLCTCGLSTMKGPQDLWNKHVQTETEYVQWLSSIRLKRSKRSGSFWE